MDTALFTEEYGIEDALGETALDNGMLEITFEESVTGVEGMADTDEAELDPIDVKTKTREEIRWRDEPLEKPLLGTDDKPEAGRLVDDTVPAKEMDEIPVEAMPAEEDTSVDNPAVIEVS